MTIVLFALFEDGVRGRGSHLSAGNLPMVGHAAVMHNWTSLTSFASRLDSEIVEVSNNTLLPY